MQMLANQKLLTTPNQSTTMTDTTNNLSNLSQKGSENTNPDLADSSLDLTRGNFYKRQKVLGSDDEDFLFQKSQPYNLVR